jgi:predicted phosphoribosyltransferase
MSTTLPRVATGRPVGQPSNTLVERAVSAGAALDIEFADHARLSETALALAQLAQAGSDAVVVAASTDAELLAEAVTRYIGPSSAADRDGPVILVDTILATGVQLSATVHRLRQSGVTVQRAVVVAADLEALARTRTDLAIEVDALRALA